MTGKRGWGEPEIMGHLAQIRFKEPSMIVNIIRKSETQGRLVIQGEKARIDKEFLTINSLVADFHEFVYTNGYEAHKEFKPDRIFLGLDYETLKEEAAPQEIEKAAVEFHENKLEMADQFLKKQPLIYDREKTWWRWVWKEKRWAIVDETDIMGKISAALENEGWVIPSKNMTEISNALKIRARQYPVQEIKSSWIQFKNAIVDIETGERIEPCPEFFCVNPIPWKLGEKKDIPKIRKLLVDWVGKENVKKLLEIIAYSMLPDYPIHRVFALVGSGRNGKGCFLRLLNKFLGEHNTTSTTLNQMNYNVFETSKLHKKLIATVSETNIKALGSSEMIKALSGQDRVSAQRKHRDQFDFTNYAKIIVATNSLPITTDKTDGFYSRWIITKFPNRFKDDKNVLKDIPEEEFENMAALSLDVLKEIISKGEFTGQGEIEDRKKVYEEASNPVLMFLNNNFEKAFGGRVAFGDFYDSLRAYLGENGYRDFSAVEVSKILKESGFEIKAVKVKTTTVKGIFNIGLSSLSSLSIPYLSFPYRELSGTMDKLDKPDKPEKQKTLSIEEVISRIPTRGGGITEKELAEKCNNQDVSCLLEQLSREGRIFQLYPGVWRQT